MSQLTTRMERLQQDIGELVERHVGKRRDLRKYRGRTLAKVRAFAREVCRLELTRQQEQIVELYCTHRFAAVRSAIGIGKTMTAALVVLYHVYVEAGMVVCLAASDRQVKELLFGAIRRLWHEAGDLPGELFQAALRVDEATGQLAIGFATTEAAKLRGWHHKDLLVVTDESQGLEPWVWEGVLALATGEANRILAIGNPGPPTGPWYDLHRNPSWGRLVLSCLDHPNIVTGRAIIPGGPSRAWLEYIEREYGAASGYYRAVVLGEFAEEVGEGLLERAWIDAAIARWETKALEAEAIRSGELMAALDVARFGSDRSALLLREGPVVRGIATWHHCDTMETLDRACRALAGWGVRIWPYQMTEGSIPPDRMRELFPEPPNPANAALVAYGPLRPGRLVIDVIGIGAGAYDRARERRLHVVEFTASSAPSSEEAGRMVNRRAEAAWEMRRQFEDGRLAIPRNADLVEELLALRWHQNPVSGKIQLDAKDETRATLGRSPDLADALMMVLKGPAGAAFTPVEVAWG